MSDNDEEFPVPPETRSGNADGQDNKGSEQRPRLGVLLVHGIGEQKRGETVPWAGDPLFKWLRSWVSRNQDKGYASDDSTGGVFAASYPHRVYMTDTRLAHAIPSEVDAPPFTRVWFQESESGPSENDPHWIMAESHWAAEFVTPPYNQVLQWGLGVAPVMIEQTGLMVIRETFGLINERQRDIERRWQGGIFSRLGVGVGKALTVISQALTWLISRIILLVLGLVAQLLILAVMVLGFIPPLQGLVVKLQAALAGEFGDAYLAAANDVEFDSMVSQVRRDVEWLAGEGETQGRCHAVAVIAHSGGTEVAYRALAGPHTPDAPGVCTTDNPILLVTYGNDQSKINTVRHLLSRKGVLTVLTIARLVALIPLWFALVGLMQGQIEDHEQTLLISLAVFGIGVELLLWIGGGILIRGTRKEKPFRPAIPDGVAWIDYRAPMDVVPDGDIVATPHGGERAKRTEPVSNLHSLIQDHGWYWNNAEEYVSDVARLLFAQAEGQDLATNGDPQGIETLKEAAHKRRNRVHRYLGLGLAVILSMPALWVCAWPWIFYAGEFVRKLIADLVSSLTGGLFNINAPAGFQTHFWAALIGMAISAVVVGLLYQLLPFQLFSAWSRNDKDAMFRRYLDREGEDGDGQKDSRFPAILFLATAALIPIVLLAYLVWIIIYPNSTVHSLEVFKMWDVPVGLILLWALPILQFLIAAVHAFHTVWAWKEISLPPGERPRVVFGEVFSRLAEAWASRQPNAAAAPLTPPES